MFLTFLLLRIFLFYRESHLMPLYVHSFIHPLSFHHLNIRATFHGSVELAF